MGRLNHDPMIHHFSHPHPLELSNLPLPSLCSACELNSSGWIYSCKPCNFTLHMSCTQLPPLITHPSHPIHPLPLLPSPVYPGGAFNCDGCGRDGRGFSYHCSHCGFDLHVTCAQNPVSLSHHSHPHMLHLTFQPPYHTKGFSCDICKKLGSNHWLYRCGMCEFDAHLDCTMGVGLPAQPQPQPQPQLQPVVGQPYVSLQHYNSFPGIMFNQQHQQSSYAKSQSMGPTNYGQQPVCQSNNPTMDVVVQGFVDGAAQQVGQNLVQSIMGGGGGGSNNNDPNVGGTSSSIISIGSSILGGMFGSSN